MKREELFVERARKAEQDRRNEELARRMAHERTFKEMLSELAAVGGLNVEEREFARAV